METIKFSDHKDRILAALNTRATYIGEPTSLVEGFFMQPLSNDISGNIVIGGPRVPMVAVIGNKSGRMYFFALKALLPDLAI